MWVRRSRSGSPKCQSLSTGTTTIVGTEGTSTETSAVATPSAGSTAGSTAGKSSSFSIGAAAVIGVSCTVAAVFVAALLSFPPFVAGELQGSHLNTAAPQVGLDNGDLAAGRRKYRKSEGFGSTRA